MLDPLTALGLASNIIAFVDFSIKIAELSHEFKDAVSGLPKDLERIAITVDDLASLVRRLQQAQIGTTASVTLPQAQKFGLILLGCVREAETFEKLLLSLKVTGRHKGWASFWSALKSVRKGGEIKAIEHALESYKSQISLRLQEETLSKQNYIAELSDRSRTERIQEAQDSADALRQLESTIGASLQQMGNDVRQILQDESNRAPQDATSFEQARRIQEQVAAEIANFRADFISLRNEIQQVRREAGVFELPVRPGVIQLRSVRSRRHTRGRNVGYIGQTALRNQTQVQHSTEANAISSDTPKHQIRIQIAIRVGIGGDVKEMVGSLKSMLYTSWSRTLHIISISRPSVTEYRPRWRPLPSASPRVRPDQLRSLIEAPPRNVQVDRLIFHQDQYSQIMVFASMRLVNRPESPEFPITFRVTGAGSALSVMIDSINIRTPPAQALLAYSPVVSSSPASLMSSNMDFPLIEGSTHDTENEAEDADQALDPDLPFYQSDDDQDFDHADQVSDDDVNEKHANTLLTAPSETYLISSDALLGEHKPAHHQRRRKRTAPKLTLLEGLYRALVFILCSSLFFVASYHLGKYLFPMEQPSQEPGERGAWCYWTLQSDGFWRYCDWCQKGYEYRDGVCVLSLGD